VAFDVLSRATSVVGSRLLEASAGTGKTFTIEHLVIRLLLERTPFPLEEILVMTFTRAATRELRQRIFRRLQLTREQLRQRKEMPDFLVARLESEPEAAAEMMRALDLAISCFEDAKITTIHGFAGRLLSTHGLLAGLASQGEKEEPEDLATRERALVEVWKELLRPPHYSVAQVSIAMNKLFTQSETFLREFLSDLAPMAQRGSMKNWGELLTEFREGLLHLKDPLLDVQQLYSEVAALLPFYNKAKDPSLLEGLPILAGMVQEGECSEEQFDELLLVESFLEKLLPENRSRVRKNPPELSSLLVRMQQLLLPPLLQAKDRDLLYTRLLLDSQEALSKGPSRSPDQLLLKLRRAVDSSEFCQQVASSYRAVILDEFQDTDRIQWEIFEKLFVRAAHPPVIYLVGDPKQSIYRFRSADVYTYLAARSALGDQAPALLETNFRSTPALVEALCRLFMRAGEKLFPLPRVAGQGQERGLAFHPVKAAENAPAPLEDGKRALHLLIPETAASVGAAQESYFLPFLSREMISLAEGGCSFSEMAVLVRDWGQAREVESLLKAAAIPCELRKQSPPAGLASYQWICALMELLIKPYDERRLRFFLLHPLVSSSLEKSSFAEARLLWQQIYSLWEAGERPRFFQQLLDAKWQGDHSIRMRAVSSKWKGALSEIRSWIALLLGQEREGRSDPLALLSFLLSYAEDAEKAAVAQESGGGVQILTGHASKGLEFSVVFAWGLMKRSRASCRVITCPAGRLLPHDPESPETQLHHAEERAEKLRQLYVVLTRAKRRVYLPLPRFSTKPGLLNDLSSSELLLEACGKTDPFSLAQELHEEGTASYEILASGAERVSCSDKREEVRLYMKQPPPMRFKPWTVLSFSSQVEGLPKRSLRGEGEDLLGSGKEVGTLLHEILADLFRGRLPRRELPTKLPSRLKGSLLEGKERLVLELIERNLEIGLGKKSLGEISPSRCQVEMSFFMAEAEERRIGFIDLFFEDGGRYYMVDWKSHFLGERDEEYSEARLSEVIAMHRYDLQAEGYTKALARYLALFDSRPFEEIFGGMFFVFLRGAKVWRHG